MPYSWLILGKSAIGPKRSGRAPCAHEIKNPLNFVNNFSGVSAELIDELRDTLKGPLDDKARAEINELKE
jgi:hypothetical protein